MRYSNKEIADYRILRATEALDEARLLGQFNHWNSTTNRLYYSCFYVASAYLVINNISAFTHKGVKISFNRELIRTRRIDSDFGRLYNDLLNLRLDADYKDFNDVTKVTIQPLFDEVKKLIGVVETIIEAKL